MLAKSLHARGSELSYRQELNEALRLNPGLSSARLELAQSLTAGKSAKTALEVLNQAPSSQKNTLPYIETRNWVLLAMGNDAEASKGVQQGLVLGRTGDLVLQQAVLKMVEKDYSGARLNAEEALKLNPVEVRAVRIVMDSYAAQRQNSTAENRIREIAKQHPESAPLQQMLGMWLVNHQKPDEARTAFLAAKSADPKFTVADLSLAELDIAAGKLDAARRTLSPLVSTDGNNTARLMLAGVEEKAENDPAATELYRAAVEKDSQNVTALNSLASILVKADLNEALKYAQQAAALAPDDADVQETLGWIYYRMKLYKNAVEYLNNAETKEVTPRRQLHLGLAYLKLGDRTLGEKNISAALQKDPKLDLSER